VAVTPFARVGQRVGSYGKGRAGTPCYLSVPARQQGATASQVNRALYGRKNSGSGNAKSKRKWRFALGESERRGPHRQSRPAFVSAPPPKKKRSLRARIRTGCGATNRLPSRTAGIKETPLRWVTRNRQPLYGHLQPYLRKRRRGAFWSDPESASPKGGIWRSGTAYFQPGTDSLFKLKRVHPRPP
jgi:hypothetical protein